MGLINLTTNLKGLGFGGDRYSGGSSNEPYIKTQIPATDESLQTGFSLSSGGLETLGIIAASAGAGAAIGAIGGSALGGAAAAGAVIGTVVGTGIGIAGAAGQSTSGNPSVFKVPSAGTGGPDFLLRGGTLLPNRIIRDVERIGNLIIDTKSAKGFLFTTKQNLLSRVAVKTEGTQGALLNEGVYLPTSTLASVAGVALGGYFNKQGANPFSGIGESYVPNKYFTVIKDQLYEFINGAPDYILNNRLYGLLDNKILRNPYFSGFYKKLDISEDSQDILSYRGGPGATLGIGNTNIKFADQRTGINNLWIGELYKAKIINGENQDISRPNFSVIKRFKEGGVNQTSLTLSDNKIDYSDLGGASNAYSTTFDQPILDNGFNGEGGTQTKTFGPDDKNQTLSTLSASLYPESITLNYNNKIIGKKILNNEQSRIDNKAYISYLNDLSGSYKGVAEFTNIDETETNRGRSIDRIVDDINIEADNFEGDDIINFYISIIGEGNTYYFPAYINSFSDGYSAKWNTEKFLGRGEDFYTYNGFSRDFSLSFITYARNPYAMQKMYNNLNQITAALTPKYLGGFMQGNLFKITLGSYLQNQPCIIESFKFDNIISDNITWQINDEFALPYLFNISISFKPIYNTLPSINNPTFINSDINEDIISNINDFNSYQFNAIP